MFWLFSADVFHQKKRFGSDSRDVLPLCAWTSGVHALEAQHPLQFDSVRFSSTVQSCPAWNRCRVWKCLKCPQCVREILGNIVFVPDTLIMPAFVHSDWNQLLHAKVHKTQRTMHTNPVRCSSDALSNTSGPKQEMFSRRTSQSCASALASSASMASMVSMVSMASMASMHLSPGSKLDRIQKSKASKKLKKASKGS